jgi:hypothetical protein
MRRSIGIGTVALLALLIPASVLAKEGNLTTASIDTAGNPPQAGATVRLGITILITHQTWNGSSVVTTSDPERWTGPTNGTSLSLIAENTATHHSVWATAMPDGGPGHYVANVTFPGDGAWRFVLRPADPTRAPEALGRIVLTNSVLRVLPAVAPAAEPRPVLPPAAVPVPAPAKPAPVQPAPVAPVAAPAQPPESGLPAWLLVAIAALAAFAVGGLAVVARVKHGPAHRMA